MSQKNSIREKAINKRGWNYVDLHPFELTIFKRYKVFVRASSYEFLKRLHYFSPTCFDSKKKKRREINSNNNSKLAKVLQQKFSQWCRLWDVLATLASVWKFLIAVEIISLTDKRDELFCRIKLWTECVWKKIGYDSGW